MPLALPDPYVEPDGHQRNFDALALAIPDGNTWLKLATAADVHVSFGTYVITGNGTSSKTDAGISHNLGTTPSVIVATVSSVNSVEFMASVQSFTATTFTLTVVHTHRVVWNSANTVYWVAIG